MCDSIGSYFSKFLLIRNSFNFQWGADATPAAPAAAGFGAAPAPAAAASDEWGTATDMAAAKEWGAAEPVSTEWGAQAGGESWS